MQADLADGRQPSWMLVRLALDTRAFHAIADSDRLVLLEHSTTARYRAFLAMVFGFEVVYEAAFAAAPRVHREFGRARAKSDRLAADLVALGLTASQVANLPQCSTVPTFRTPAHAMGWLYAIERNTLLHGLLRRHLTTVIPEAIEQAGSYLATYGDTPGARYRELGVALDGFGAIGGDIPRQLATAASEAFRAQHAWCSASTARSSVVEDVVLASHG